MKGRIIEIDGDTAIVFTKKAEFVKTKNFSGLTVGDEITLYPQFKYIKSAAAAAAAIALFAGGAVSYCTPVSYVDICINPEIELKINMFERVIGAVGKNDDGAAVLAERGVKNIKVDKALGSIIENAEELGFINENEEKTVVLSVFAKKDSNAKETYDDIASYKMPENINKVVKLASSKDVARANKEKMPVGKYLLMTELSQMSKALPKEEIKNYSVKEIITTLDKVKEKKPANSDNGSAPERKTDENTSITPKPAHTERPSAAGETENANIGKTRHNTDSTVVQNTAYAVDTADGVRVPAAVDGKDVFAEIKADTEPIKNAKTKKTAVVYGDTETSSKPDTNKRDSVYSQTIPEKVIPKPDNDAENVVTIPEIKDNSDKESFPPPTADGAVNPHTPDKDNVFDIGNGIGSNAADNGANSVINNGGSGGGRYDKNENGTAEDIRNPVDDNTMQPPQDVYEEEKREPEDNAPWGTNDFPQFDNDNTAWGDVGSIPEFSDKPEFDFEEDGFEEDKDKSERPFDGSPEHRFEPTDDFGGWHAESEPSDEDMRDDVPRNEPTDNFGGWHAESEPSDEDMRDDVPRNEPTDDFGGWHAESEPSDEDMRDDVPRNEPTDDFGGWHAESEPSDGDMRDDVPRNEPSDNFGGWHAESEPSDNFGGFGGEREPRYDGGHIDSGADRGENGNAPPMGEM